MQILMRNVPGDSNEQFILKKDFDQKTNDELFQAIGFQEFNENVEKMYASSILMSSKDCASGTC